MSFQGGNLLPGVTQAGQDLFGVRAQGGGDALSGGLLITELDGHPGHHQVVAVLQRDPGEVVVGPGLLGFIKSGIKNRRDE